MKFQGRLIYFAEGLVSPKPGIVIFYGPPSSRQLTAFDKRANVAWVLADVEITNPKKRPPSGDDSAVIHLLLNARTQQEVEDKLEVWLPKKGYLFKAIDHIAVFDAVGWEDREEQNFYEKLLERVLAGRGPQLGRFHYYDSSDPDDEA